MLVEKYSHYSTGQGLHVVQVLPLDYNYYYTFSDGLIYSTQFLDTATYPNFTKICPIAPPLYDSS